VRGPLNTIAIAGDILGQELSTVPGVPTLVHEIVDSLKESSGTAMEQINEMMLFEKVRTRPHETPPTSLPTSPHLTPPHSPTALCAIVNVKLSAGMRSIEPQAVAILPYIRECMKPHLVPALAKNITFTLNAPPECPDLGCPVETVCAMIDPVKFKV